MLSSLHSGRVLSLLCKHLMLSALRERTLERWVAEQCQGLSYQWVMVLLVLVQCCGPTVYLTCQAWLGFYAYFAF